MSDNRKKAPTKAKRGRSIAFGIIRWTWIPLACLAALFIGLAIGYVYIGKQELDDVFSLATWSHVIELVFADT